MSERRLCSLVYVRLFGTSPFNVAYKGNKPHIDHIYPQGMLRSQLSLASGEINNIGNYRFIGSSDNLRKRAEKPATYFSRLKAANIPIEKHLLVEEYSSNPSLLGWSKEDYRRFRDRRLEEIFRIAREVVDGPHSK